MGTFEVTIFDIGIKGAGIYGQTLAALAFLVVIGLLAWKRRT
ncbi:hypothetical protein Q9314_28240 (plasmid) [Shinella sumterensis]|nr:hypothetical protein [Shinella sp.]WLS11920.1 hypothetical protein Q9314_28240 [Shinella sumterensis]